MSSSSDEQCQMEIEQMELDRKQEQRWKDSELKKKVVSLLKQLVATFKEIFGKDFEKIELLVFLNSRIEELLEFIEPMDESAVTDWKEWEEFLDGNFLSSPLRKWLSAKQIQIV
uniref:W2 domain-containing protein n=1 Tax=Meloidogyne hapla TaxID=6305 RepID=A0A1I8B3Q6_MELHA